MAVAPPAAPVAVAAPLIEVTVSHILVKHKGVRRPASWQDPSGETIKSRTREEAEEKLKEIVLLINEYIDEKVRYGCCFHIEPFSR